MIKAERKPYEERTDLEKIQSQWTKLSGLHDRTDWSAAVVRAATAAEITANFAIRQEYAAQGVIDSLTIDKKLKDANGLKGKISRILIPMLKGNAKYDIVHELKKLMEKINDKRNGIIHRGEFCSEAQATVLIQDCKLFVHGVVRLYHKEFRRL